MEKNYIDIIRNEINKASSSLSDSELKDTNDFFNRLESNNEILKNVYESLKLVFEDKSNTKETDEIIIFEKFENNKEKLKKLVDIFSFTKSIPDFSETDAKLICKLMCADPNVDGFSFNKDHFVRKDLESHVEINMVVSEILEVCLQNAKDILSDCKENNPEYNELKKDFERIKQMSDSYYTGPIYPLTLYENTDLKSQIESGSSLKNDNKWLGNFKVSDGLSFEIVTGNYDGNTIIDLRPVVNTTINNLYGIRGSGTYKGENINVEVVDDNTVVNLDSHWISYKLEDLLNFTSNEIQTKFIKDINNKINNSIVLNEIAKTINQQEIIKVENEAGVICSKLLSEDFSGNMLKKVQASIEKLTEKSFDEVCNDLGITEENGYKMLEILIKAKDYYNNNYDSKRPTAEQIAVGLEDGWDYDVALKGYSDSSNDDIDLRLSTIERIDVMEVFDSNFEAAEQAEKDGIKLIPENELNFNKYKGDLYSLHRYIDNEENRTVLKELGFIIEIKPYHVEYYLDGGYEGRTESFATVEEAVLHINDKKDLKYDFWKVTDEYDHDWAYKTKNGIEIVKDDGKSTYIYNGVVNHSNSILHKLLKDNFKQLHFSDFSSWIVENTKYRFEENSLESLLKSLDGNNRIIGLVNNELFYWQSESATDEYHSTTLKELCSMQLEVEENMKKDGLNNYYSELSSMLETIKKYPTNEFINNISWKHFSEADFNKLKSALFDNVSENHSTAGINDDAIGNYFGRIEIGNVHVELIPELSSNSSFIGLYDNYYYPDFTGAEGKTKNGLLYGYENGTGSLIHASKLKDMNYEQFKEYITNYIYSNNIDTELLNEMNKPTVDWDLREKDSPLYNQILSNINLDLSKENFEKLKIGQLTLNKTFGNISVGDLNSELFLWENGDISIEDYFPGVNNKHNLLENEIDGCYKFYELSGLSNPLKHINIKNISYEDFCNIVKNHWAEQIINNDILFEHSIRENISWDKYDVLANNLYNNYTENWKKTHEFIEGVSEPASFEEFLNNEFMEPEIIDTISKNRNDFKLYLNLMEINPDEYYENKHQNSWNIVESYYPDYYKNEMITLSNDIASWDEGNNEDFKTVQDFERRYQLGLKTREDILEYGERLDKLLYKTACAYRDNLDCKEDLLWACEHTNFNEMDLVPNSIQLKVESNDYDFIRTKALLPEDIVKQLHLNPGFKYNILADITKENKLQNFVIQSDTWKNEPFEDDIGISVETFNLKTGLNFEEIILEEMDSITQQSFELTFNPKVALYHSQSEYGGEGGDYEFDGKIDSKTLMSFDSRLDSLVPAPGDEKNDFYGVLFSDDKGSTFVELHSLKDDKILYPEALGSNGNEPVYANFELSAEAKEKLINNITRYKIEQKLDFSHFTEENFKDLQKEIIDSKDSPDIIDKEFGYVVIGDIEIPLEFEKSDVSTESEVWLNLEAYYPDENGDRDLDGMGYSREEKYGEMPAIGIRNSSSNTGAIFENCSYEEFKTIISKYVSEAIINDHLENRALEKENISLKDSAIKYNNEMITINAYDSTVENIERVKYFLSNIINNDISSETAKAFINNLGIRDYGNDEIVIPLDKSNSDKLSISRDCKTWVYDNFCFIKRGDRKLRQVKSVDLSFLIDEVYYFAESRVDNSEESHKNFELLKDLKSTYDSIKEPLTVDYAFPEYNFDKNMMEITVYEEPRWHFSNINVALNIIKENAPSLFDEIQEYVKKFTTNRLVYIDFGKSLRYDEEYSKESLEDKLDDRFIVRYCCCDDDGNLDDGGEEIVIEDKELVNKLNSMIEEHVQQNIENYKIFSESGPKVNFVLEAPEDIVLNDDSIQIRVFNNADYELEKLLDPDFDLDNDALSFYYTKNIKTGKESIYWCNHVATPNRDGYIDADTIDPDISDELVNKIYENIRNVFQKEFDSYSNDRIISEGLKENILKENKNAFLINSLISENAYNKALEDIKAQAAENFSKDFNIAINFGNNELVKELAPAANNILSDGVLSDCLYNALINDNIVAWKAILDTENSPGQIIGQNWVLLCDAAADLNEDIISDIFNRYENNREILSSLIFETNDSGKNALQVALERWKNDEYYDNDMPDMIPPAIKLLGDIEERVTKADKISLYKDKQTGDYMTVNSLINSYEINIFNSKGELLEHDTFGSYNTPDGKSNDVTSHLEAALVTMNDVLGNWHDLEIITGSNAVSLSQELYDSVSKSLQDFEASGFDNLIAYNQHKTDIELLKLLDKKDYEQINAWKKEYNIDDDNSILSELSFAKLKSIYSDKLNKHLSDSITKLNATIKAEFTNEIAPNTIVNLEPYYKTSPLIEKVPEDLIEYYISSSVFENRIEDIYNEFNLLNDTSWVMAVKKEKVKSFDNEEDVILAHLTIPDEAYIFKDVANNRMTLNDNDSLELYFTCDKRNIIKNLTLRVMSKTGETKYISLEKENNLFHAPQLDFGIIGKDFLDALKANCSDVLSNYVYEKKGLSKEEAFFVYPKPGYVVDYSNNDSMDEFTEVLNNNLIYSEEPGLTVEQGRILQKYMQKAGYQLYIDDDKGNLYYYNTDNIFNSSKDTSTAQLVLTVKDLLLNAKENKENYYKTDDERILAPLIKFYETKFVELEKNSEETNKKEQSKRTVTNRYLDSVKKLLNSEHTSIEPLEDILSAAQKALNNFTAEEKKEISDFLLSKGAKDSSSMGNIIKKSINNKDKEHKKERNEHDIHER